MVSTVSHDLETHDATEICHLPERCQHRRRTIPEGGSVDISFTMSNHGGRSK
jgi:hypothetical protein